MQTCDKVTTYPYGANVFMACENEMKYKENIYITKRKNFKYWFKSTQR